MFGIVLGVAALALAIYELATREAPSASPAPSLARGPNPAAVALPPQVAADAANNLPPGTTKAERSAFYARASVCNATVQDWIDTNAWLRSQLGGPLPVSTAAQLQLQLGRLPMVYWPRAARRIACVLGG